jgi:hypothetical protein
MSTEVPLPLNEPQQRRLTVTFAILEKHLHELREQLECGPCKLRLMHYNDPFDANEAAALLPAIREAEAGLRRMADELGLGALTEPVRWTHVAGLELDGINLYDCRADVGLSGYGAVAPATAEYLEREIPKLESAVRQVLQRLIHPDATGKQPSHG